jgi:small subunit ribosomal protein S16
MAVKIRLKRTGKHKQPSYRVVIADARSPRDGRIVENIGWYNPLTDPSTIKIDEEKALKWLQNGAQPTDSVASLLRRAGIYQKFEEQVAARKGTTTAPAPPELSQQPANP